MSNLTGIPCIVLAGGKSSRTVTPKGLIPYQDKPLLQYQVECLIRLGLVPIVVIGFHRDPYRKLLSDISGIQIVNNGSPERGPFSSIQEGLKALPENTNATFILPLDTPVPQPTTWNALVNSTKSVAVPVKDGRGGHPVFLRKEFIERLLSVETERPDARLDWQIREYKDCDCIDVKDATIFANLNALTDF